MTVRLTRNAIAGWMMLLLLIGCGPVRVIETSGCAWTKEITLDDDAFIVFVANAHDLRTVTDQINTHNDARKRECR